MKIKDFLDALHIVLNAYYTFLFSSQATLLLENILTYFVLSDIIIMQLQKGRFNGKFY